MEGGPRKNIACLGTLVRNCLGFERLFLGGVVRGVVWGVEGDFAAFERYVLRELRKGRQVGSGGQTGPVWIKVKESKNRETSKVRIDVITKAWEVVMGDMFHMCSGAHLVHRTDSVEEHGRPLAAVMVPENAADNTRIASPQQHMASHDR
ncbi:hypothetical protein E2C01_024543 [Portunus trituberculatus]|uniref:Uncharacterized protein n=1 Tax=Portunus trituberculatus TaxID=210409 RepID=A0A5B7ECL8_PORTR|nr:hypothetical protein [Portunus trituberculatus]